VDDEMGTVEMETAEDRREKVEGNFSDLVICDLVRDGEKSLRIGGEEDVEEDVEGEVCWGKSGTVEGEGEGEEEERMEVFGRVLEEIEEDEEDGREE
jgi:hypothetical protein